MRGRLLIATASSVVLAAIGAAAVRADSVATNNGATNVTSTTAVLNATVNTSDPDSLWYFQYGTTTSYGSSTQSVMVGAVNKPVSAEITGLSPSKTYYFRLVVEQGINYNPTSSTSDAKSFTTAAGGKPGGGKPGGGKPGGGATKYGKAVLKSHRLKVSSGVVTVQFRCIGGSGAICKGKIKLTARGIVGGRHRTVGCGAGKLRGPVGKLVSVKGKLSAGCKTLLSATTHHKLAAKLRATFTHQKTLKTAVKLVGQ
jgi:hypothetical protein